MGYHANPEKSVMESLNSVVARNERLETELKDVKAQLSASQQRERAAVEDMQHIANRIEHCNTEIFDGEPVNSLNLGRCDVCKKHCHDDNGCRFEWRGHQTAKEGNNP